MKIEEYRKIVKNRIAEIVEYEDGERAIVLEKTMKHMKKDEKKIFIDIIACRLSRHNIQKDDIYDAIDSILFNSEEYIKTYFAK